MAIAHVQFKNSGLIDASNVMTTAFDSGPTNGSFMLAFVSYYYASSGPSVFNWTTPSGYTKLIEQTSAFEAICAAFYDTFTTGDGSTITATHSGTSQRGGEIVGIEISGASGIKAISGKATGSEVTNLTVTCTGAVTTAGTRVYAAFARDSASEAPGTPTYSSGWTELTKTQVNGVECEIYVAYKDYDSGTPSCDLSGMTAADMAGVIVAVEPTTNAAPTVSDPGTIQTALNHVEDIGAQVTVGDADGNLSTIRYQGTNGKVRFSYTASGTSSISAGANNSNDLTITADNQTDLLAAHALTTMTCLMENDTDTVTITATDDAAASDAQAFMVDGVYLDVEGASETLLNTYLSLLTAESAVAAVYTLNVTGIDDQSLEGTGAGTVTVNDLSVVPVIRQQLELMMRG